MAVNTHGLKLHGIKMASKLTCNEKPYSNWHHMVFMDTDSWEVWTRQVYGTNNWVVYPNDDKIVCIADVQYHTTMQDIADAAYDSL